jgi:hypothetical protein
MSEGEKRSGVIHRYWPERFYGFVLADEDRQARCVLDHGVTPTSW